MRDKNGQEIISGDLVTCEWFFYDDFIENGIVLDHDEEYVKVLINSPTRFVLDVYEFRRQDIEKIA